ncbi:MAG: hypothetical protein NZ828_12060 [Alphaproteobacteria bacterium]|nr:hypothetical protein [Alphaproteobacteria bacterium]
MAQSSEMIGQIVEKLGMPIIAAVSEVERQKQAMGRVQGVQSDEAQARLVAELLGKSTELGLMLFRSFDINEPTESRADAARLGLTALSSTVIANLYGMTGRIPGEPELQRLEKVVQSVVAFSDNYETGQDATQVMAAADVEKAGGLSVLDYSAVHYASALIPVVNAVAAFPFGRPEDQLMKEVMQRLMGVVSAVASRLYAGLNDAQKKSVELALMKVAANTYAQCHFAEMTQLMSSGDQQKMMAQNLSMDGIWQAFDKRFSMLETVVTSLSGADQASSSGSSGVVPSAPPPPAAPPPVETAPQQPAAAPVDTTQPPPAAPVDVTQPAAAPVEPPPPAAPAADSSDPMAFFSAPPPASEE